MYNAGIPQRPRHRQRPGTVYRTAMNLSRSVPPGELTFANWASYRRSVIAGERHIEYQPPAIPRAASAVAAGKAQAPHATAPRGEKKSPADAKSQSPTLAGALSRFLPTLAWRWISGGDARRARKLRLRRERGMASSGHAGPVAGMGDDGVKKEAGRDSQEEVVELRPHADDQQDVDRLLREMERWHGVMDILRCDMDRLLGHPPAMNEVVLGEHKITASAVLGGRLMYHYGSAWQPFPIKVELLSQLIPLEEAEAKTRPVLQWYTAGELKSTPTLIRKFHDANPGAPGPPRRLSYWMEADRGRGCIIPHPDDDVPED